MFVTCHGELFLRPLRSSATTSNPFRVHSKASAVLRLSDCTLLRRGHTTVDTIGITLAWMTFAVFPAHKGSFLSTPVLLGDRFIWTAVRSRAFGVADPRGARGRTGGVRAAAKEASRKNSGPAQRKCPSSPLLVHNLTTVRVLSTTIARGKGWLVGSSPLGFALSLGMFGLPTVVCRASCEFPCHCRFF